MSCHIQAGKRHYGLQLFGLPALMDTLADQIYAARHELLEQFDELLAFDHVHSLADPLLPVWLVAEVLGVNVDHATARDGRRRCVLQVIHLQTQHTLQGRIQKMNLEGANSGGLGMEVPQWGPGAEPR